MSDSGDFRASREEKRQDETVMISQDNLSDMVSQAKSDAGSADDDGSGGPNMVIIGVGVALLLIVVIALVYYR